MECDEKSLVLGWEGGGAADLHRGTVSVPFYKRDRIAALSKKDPESPPEFLYPFFCLAPWTASITRIPEISVCLRQISEFLPCAIRLLAPTIHKSELRVVAARHFLAGSQLNPWIT